MKLHEVVAEFNIFKTMILKLVAAQQPIFVEAHGRTFQTGPMNGPFENRRSKGKGWVVQHFRAGDAETMIEQLLDSGSLQISAYKNYAMDGSGTIHGASFNLEQPIDDHYTIKKRNGVWTVLDKEPVTEAHKEDEDFLLQMVHKKMRHAGLSSVFHPADGKTAVKPYIMTRYAAFEVKTFYGSPTLKKGENVLCNVWFHNGKRVSDIKQVDTAKGAIKDIAHDLIDEAVDEVEMERDNERFMLKMMQKLLEREGYKTLPFDGESVDLILHVYKVVIMHFANKEKPWSVTWFDKETSKLIERQWVDSPQRVLRMLNQYQRKQ